MVALAYVLVVDGSNRNNGPQRRMGDIDPTESRVSCADYRRYNRA